MLLASLDWLVDTSALLREPVAIADRIPQEETV